MRTKGMSLSIGTVIGLALVITLTADLRPSVVTNLTGTLRVQQGVPCASDIDLTTPVGGGHLELTPSEGVDAVGGGKFFILTRATIDFAGFSVTRSCLGFSETRTYGLIQVRLARSVSFTAQPTATQGVFAVTIPREDFEVFYTTAVNGGLERGNKRPIADVTGTIDLAAGTMTMHVVLGTRVTFKAGCTFLGCIIDETHDGRLTANLSGTILFPDTDRDGVPDRADNCRYVANPDQAPVPTPAITAPADVTLDSCLSRGFGFAAAADVCDGAPVTVTHDAPTRFDLGGNVVTWRAQDAASRIASDTQTVTIIDRTPPVFTSVPPDVFLDDCGPANLGTPTATDDCAGTPALTNDAPPKFFVGSTPVTWTATDVSGNQRATVQTVHVVDTVAPTVFCTPTNPTGSSFRVSAIDSCTSAPVIRLGDFVIADGEVIMINETGRPGVRLHNIVGAGQIRHFHVGRGEAVIAAADESGNVGSITCSVPR